LTNFQSRNVGHMWVVRLFEAYLCKQTVKDP